MNTIQYSLNSLMNEYHKIAVKGKKNRNTNIEILTHSGSAPIDGWVNNGLKGYSKQKIWEAIHVYPIERHDYAEIHYRDNFIWHAWLKVNDPHFIYHYSPTDKVNNNPILSNITPNTDIDIDRFNPNNINTQFETDFIGFNHKYPIIGLLHRCLIIMRFLDETFRDEPKFVLHIMNLQGLYHPLFYYINLLIHVDILLRAFGNVDYNNIFYNPISTLNSKKYPLLSENLISEEDYNNKNFKFDRIIKGLSDIINKHYSKLELLYEDIHKILLDTCNKMGTKIKDFKKPYYLEKTSPRTKSSTISKLPPRPRPRTKSSTNRKPRPTPRPRTKSSSNRKPSVNRESRTKKSHRSKNITPPPTYNEIILEDNLIKLKAMGFDEKQAKSALKHSDNLEMAIKILLPGDTNED